MKTQINSFDKPPLIQLLKSLNFTPPLMLNLFKLDSKLKGFKVVIEI